jgi:hypothetical protein
VKRLINRRVSALAALAPLTLLLVRGDVVFGASPAAKGYKTASTAISVKADQDPFSAKSAVSLIELIKQRLRSLPQLAVNNTKQAIAFQSQEMEPQAPLIAADPHLLIKPKDRQMDFRALEERAANLPTNANLQSVISKSPLISDFDIALIPPTIVSGIPALRLGSSTKEAKQSIFELGQVSKQHFDDWTVWSVYKAKENEGFKGKTEHDSSKTEAAGSCRLQVFMQAGMVEAMRVFDPSLLKSNLGITLGDDLFVIKRKFGEPAFILAEPNQRISQNYIYPINQIGFQLERRNNEDAPRIVSVLIFNAR